MLNIPVRDPEPPPPSPMLPSFMFPTVSTKPKKGRASKRGSPEYQVTNTTYEDLPI